MSAPVALEACFPAAAWRGRTDDVEGSHGRRWHQVVQPLSAQRSGAALLGFASDGGVTRNQGRGGAREGPAALRAQLANLPARANGMPIADGGDVACTGEKDLERAQRAFAGRVQDVLARGMLPVGLGGGHEIAWASFEGLARHVMAGAPSRPPRIGTVNLDAHFDLRLDDRATSGTPFLQIAQDCAARGWLFHYCCLGVSEFANTQALFDRAAALGVAWRTDEQMDGGLGGENAGLLERFMGAADFLYLTVCLDVLPPWVAPGVSAPSARGVPLSVVEAVVDAVAASGKLLVADVAELNPSRDIDSRTARIAARLVARIVERAARATSR